MQDFSGVALRDDSVVEVLSGPAGGHGGNIVNNRVMSLRLDLDSPAWVQRRGASNASGWDPTGAASPYFSDGRPAPRHLYTHAWWLPAQRQYLIGGTFWGSGQSNPRVQDAFTPVGDAGGDWERAGTYPNRPAQGAHLSVRNPASGVLYAIPGYGNDGYQFDPATKTWALWNLTGSGSTAYGATAWDSKRGRIFNLSGGDWYTNNNNGSHVSTLIDPGAKSKAAVRFNASAGWTDFQAGMGNMIGSGLAYDAADDKFYFYNGNTGDPRTSGQGSKLYRIVPNDTLTWDMEVMHPPGVTPADGGDGGCMTKFFIVPRWRTLFLIVGGQDVYYLRLASTFSTALRIRSGTVTGALPYTATLLPMAGDIPPGQVIVSDDDSSMAASVINTHADGSAAVVVVAGQTTVTANNSISLALRCTAQPAASATPLTAARVAALVSNVTVNFAGNYGSATLTNFSNPERVWWVNSRVICARYRLAAPTPGNTALEAVIDIHAYASPHDRALVEMTIENGRIDALLSSSAIKPGDARYSGATVSVNGTAVVTVNSADNPRATHQAFRSWHARTWVGGDPMLRATQAHEDLQRHALFWHCDQPSTADLSAYANDSYKPWGTGRHRAFGMGGGGVDETIGPLPLWEAQALQSGDWRAWNAVEQNALAVLSFNINYRDTTGLVPNAARMPAKCQQSSKANWPVTTASDAWATFEGAHQPAAGLMAFVARPSPVFIELAQKIAVWSGTSDSTNDRLSMFNGLSVGLTDLTGFPANGQTRSYAWGLRQLTHALFLSPNGSAWREGGKTWLGRAARFGLAIMQSPKANLNLMWSGAPAEYIDHDNNTVPGYQLSTFMHHYAVGEVHKAASARLLTDTTEQAFLSDFADWMAASAARWINELPNGSWRFASYDFSYLRADLSTYATYAQARANDVSGSGPSSTTGPWLAPTFQEPSTWTQWNAVAPVNTAGTGYEVYLWYSLVAAVERRVPGASTAWTTVNDGITNLSTWRQGFGTNPRWGAYPRNL